MNDNNCGGVADNVLDIMIDIDTEDEFAYLLVDETSGSKAARPLYLHYDPSARRVWLRNTYVSEIGTCTEAVYHGRELRHKIPATIDPRYLAEWLKSAEAQDVLRRVASGYTIRVVDGNRVGRLSEDADEAWDSLQEAWDLDSYMHLGEQAGVWPADEWLMHSDPAAMGLTADSTDEQLAEIVADVERYAREEYIVLHGTAAYLLKVRDELRCSE